MTVHEALRCTMGKINAIAGTDSAFEARELLAYALGMKRFPHGEYARIMTDKELEDLDSLVDRRLRHEPLQYIIGEWEFMGLPFKVDSRALIPRQDTETLCEEAERLIRSSGTMALLDICTGTGCIGIALSKRTGVRATLSDISRDCLELARENAELNDVHCEFVQSDLFDGIDGRFDLISANPPYIRTEVINGLQSELAYEPRLALDGGADGMRLYRRIRDGFSEHLNPGGILLMELGFDQGDALAELFADCGRVRIIKDINVHDRVMVVET